MEYAERIERLLNPVEAEGFEQLQNHLQALL